MKCIPYWVLLIWVFLSVYNYRTLRPAELRFTACRILDFDISKSGFSGGPACLAFDHEIDPVEVGFALPPAGDPDEAGSLQFLDELVHPRDAHAHVMRQAILAGEATVVVPGEMQEHRIGNLGAQAEGAIAENEIRHLGKPAAGDGILRRQLDVAVPQRRSDVLHACIVARLQTRLGVIPRFVPGA